MLSQMAVQDDCILVNDRLAVTLQLRQVVLKRIHRGHPGQEAMLGASKYLCWTQHMHKDIVNLAEECRSCTRYGKKIIYLIPKNASKPLPLLTQPGHEVQLDYAGPLESHRGKIYLLVAIDRFSKFPSVKVTKSTSGKCTVKILRSPIHIQDKVEKEIEKLLTEGHINKLDKCTSDCFIAPIVITVRKR